MKINPKQKEYYQNNSEKHEIPKEYYQNNSENSIKNIRNTIKITVKNLEKTKEYYQNNSEKVLKKQKEYYQNNSEKQKEYKKKKYHSDVNFKIKVNLRNRLYSALKAQGATKSASTMTLTGLNSAKLKEWIASQFEEGMSWDTIHIDHMMPCASFDLTDPIQQKQCFHYTNLKPEFAADNMSYGATIKHDMKWLADQWYIKSANGLYKPRSIYKII